MPKLNDEKLYIPYNFNTREVGYVISPCKKDVRDQHIKRDGLGQSWKQYYAWGWRVVSVNLIERIGHVDNS